MRLAHQMAMESDLITADMVEVQEFIFLAQKYNIYGVPKTVINESLHFEGAVPDAVFLGKVLQVAETKPAGEKK